MKPNGLVVAASITSQTSMPMRSQSIASSLTRAMLTRPEGVLEQLGQLGGVAASETGTTCSTHARVERQRPLGAAGVRPPTTLGMVRRS